MQEGSNLHQVFPTTVKDMMAVKWSASLAANLKVARLNPALLCPLKLGMFDDSILVNLSNAV